MELFTLGVDDFTGLNNYEQQDIVQIARAFTGWRFDWKTGKTSFSTWRHAYAADYPLRGPKVIVTTRGGMTSHAAVVARGMGRPCVSGASELRVDVKSAVIRVRDVEIREGDIITIDGSPGEVMLGDVPAIQPGLAGDLAVIIDWAVPGR